MIQAKAMSRVRSLLVGAGCRLADSGMRRLDGLSQRLRYVQWSHDFESLPDDIFIVTYPRSGTTLVQMMAHELRPEPATDFTHIEDVVPTFEDLPRRPGFDLRGLPRPRFFKTHQPVHRLPQGLRYIYVARDPRDVALSTFHFARHSAHSDGAFDGFLRFFLSGGGPFGSWREHVASALKARHRAKVLFLTYEQLTSDIVGCTRRLAAFAELGVDEAKLARIAHRCSFQYMQEHEERFHPHLRDMIGRPASPASPSMVRKSFIRSGVAGANRVELTHSQQALFGERLHALKSQVDALASRQ